ncbi:MAG: sulfatase [Bacteroidia bacterium]
MVFQPFLIQIFILLSGIFFTNGSILPATTPPPNFIFILTDDQGWSSTSFLMDRNIASSASDFFETPQMKRLAEMGMRFSNGYAPAPLCSPTRRSIQFGQTPARQGEKAFNATHNPVNFPRLTIPLMLKAANPSYQTAHYGKWDLRSGVFPEDLGYDESDGNTGNRNGNIFQGKDEKWTEVFVSSDPKKIESITARGLNFMERQVRSGTPFYLQLSHYATHVDMQTREETLAKYENKPPGKAHYLPGYAGMLEDLDTGVGAILDKVEALGISKNTYIILMSDNGGVPFVPPGPDYLVHPSEYPQTGRNFPLRGGKWTVFEGGIRVPFLVAGPGIPANQQCDQPVIGWDILPTLADLAGYAPVLPEDIDGVSIRPLLEKGNQGTIHRTDFGLVFHRFGEGRKQSAIRIGDDKLVKLWKTNELLLFDLKNDPGELTDLSQKYPEKVARLHENLIAYLSKVDSEVLIKK